MYIVGTNNLHRTSSEMSEAFRLKQALPNSDLQAPVKRSISFTCSQSTHQGTNTPSTQSSTLFHTQLPAPQQPAQHQPAEAYLPPQNLCNFKPWLKSAENSSKPLPSTIAFNTMAFGSADNGGSSATPAIWNTLAAKPSNISRPTSFAPLSNHLKTLPSPGTTMSTFSLSTKMPW
jgi:hypothetical protein